MARERCRPAWWWSSARCASYRTRRPRCGGAALPEKRPDDGLDGAAAARCHRRRRSSRCSISSTRCRRAGRRSRRRERDHDALDDHDESPDVLAAPPVVRDALDGREASLPPPTPVEVVRRGSLGPAAPEPASRRASGPFEELDLVEFEGRPTPPVEAPRYSSPPAVPPAPPLSTLPDARLRARRVGAPTQRRACKTPPDKPRTHAGGTVLRRRLPEHGAPAVTRADSPGSATSSRSASGSAGASLLDVGCGLGMLVLRADCAVGTGGGARPVARDAVARVGRGQARALRGELSAADMRELGFEGSFDAVTCLGTTLGTYDDGPTGA